MLNLRSALVLTAAALCLWGLFSLLSSLKEPGLLRSRKAAVVKGCEVMDSADTRRICQPLFCQKALIDAKLAAWDASFTAREQRTSAADARFVVITGTLADTAHVTPQPFGCLLEGHAIRALELMNAAATEDFLQAVDDEPERFIRP
jgi:hypothetical protein